MSKRTIAIIVHDTQGNPVKNAAIAIYNIAALVTTDSNGIVQTNNIDGSVQDICLKVLSSDIVEPYIVSPLIPANKDFNLGIGIPVGPGDVSVMPGPTSKNSGVFPQVPTSEQVCGVNIQFQGEMITIDGTKWPWFEPALVAFDSSQRQQIYSQKKVNKDTHCIVGFSKGGVIYNSKDDQPYKHISSPDYESDPQLFLSLIEEIIINGFIPGIAYYGDNGMDVNNGYPNALRQLPILVNLLKSSKYGDLNQYCLMLRFWDGVFYGSTPESIQNFGTEFRKLNPGGYLGIEFNPGHIPAGNGPADYESGGMLDGYDVLFAEYADEAETSPDAPDKGNQTVWQVNGRLVRPYNRPPDQIGDQSPPFYLIDSPRGKRFFCAFENSFLYGAYVWVRVDVNNYQDLQNKIAQRRQYMKSMGCTYTG